MTTNPELAPDMLEDIYAIEIDGKIIPYVGCKADCEEEAKAWRINGKDTAKAIPIILARADLAPQAGSVDVEGLRKELRKISDQTENSGGWHFVDKIIDHLASRNLLAGAPVGGDEINDLKRQLRLAQHNFEHYYTRYMDATGKTTAECEAEWEKTNPILYGFPEQSRPAIPGLQEAQGWQTVENVPRDQDVLVGYLNHAGEVEDVSVAYVSEGEKYHINSIYAEPRGDCRHCGGACKRVYVTHWMPLPAAPRDGRD